MPEPLMIYVGIDAEGRVQMMARDTPNMRVPNELARWAYESRGGQYLRMSLSAARELLGVSSGN